MYYFKVFSHDEDTVATSVELKFLHYICGYWEFPKVDNIKIVDTKYVYMGPCTPVEIRICLYTSINSHIYANLILLKTFKVINY